MSEAERRLIEAEDAWLFHEQTDDMLAGYGHHMQQMLHRLPRDGQTTDMRQSIEQVLADLRDTLDALASRDARLAAVEALADEKHKPPIDLIHERCPAGGVGPGRECTACSAAGRAYLIGVEHVQRDLRAALRSDPDEASTDA